MPYVCIVCYPADSIIIMSGYSDVVVLRHPQPGAVTVSYLH